MYVIDNENQKSVFKPSKIKHKIMVETGLDEETAHKITLSVTKAIKNQYTEEVSTSTIRSLINAQLVKRGLIEEEGKSRKLGMSVSDYEDLLEHGCRDNANINFTPEMISKYAYDSIAKEYALLTQPEECANAHIEGFIHQHDLEYYNTRPNCMNYDLRFFAKNGLMIDGIGLMGSSAKPAKSFEVILNHMLQAWMAGATVFSGGQGYVNFNTLLAPFVRGRPYNEIKQAIQGFIFNCNMSLICRGGQVLFSSIGLDMRIPDELKNEPAIGIGGVPNGVYADYQNEADMIFKAVSEVSNEKDGNGAYHRFPNIIINIRKGDLDTYDGNCKILHEWGANNPTIYYVNCYEQERTVMGCLDGGEGIWCKIDNEVSYKTFYELCEMLNADYGATPVDNIKVLTIDDNKNIIWDKVKYFIKNKNQQMYKVTLSDGKSFICDDNHELLTVKGINPINIFDCTKGSNILGLNYRGNNIDFNIDYMAVLYGFYLGDGDKTNNHGIIAVSKEDKKIYLEELFDKLDVDYSYKFSERSQDERHSNPNIHKFYFSKDIINNYKPDLTDNNVLAGILSGMLSSDGYVRFTGSYNNSLCAEFVSTNFEYIKLFEYCCFMLGLKFKTSLKSKQKENHSDFKRVYISCNNNTVYVLKQLFLRNKQANLIKSISSDGYRNMNNYKSIRIKSIEKVGFGDSFCIEVNGRMIFGEEFILSAQCRTALPMNYFENYELDCLNTGNFMYNTINLPLIALSAKDNVVDFIGKDNYFDYLEQEFYGLLNYYCEIIYKSLHHRRKEVIKSVYETKMSNFLLQKDKDTGESLWDIDRTTITIGYCGLNECLMELYGGEGIIYHEEEGIKIIKMLNKKKDEFYERDGLRWSVIGSPAESTSHRFAVINKSKYPNAFVQGEKDSYYLTNSSHIPVSENVNIVSHIKNAGNFHKISQGGNILHIWLGEVWSDPIAIWKLNQKIIETDTLFWAYSKVFTYCNECGETINDEIDKCQKCGSTDLVTYDRITGYYLPTNGYNDGKQQEFKDRYRQKIEGE